MERKLVLPMRKARLLCGKTLDDLFQETGIQIPRLSRIERGIFKAHADEKGRIAKSLHVKLDEIFTVE